jgi:hypothetical protein
MMLFFGRKRRDHSGHTGQPHKHCAKRVPNKRPDSGELGTRSRDAFRSVITVLSRVSRLVPTGIE